MAWLTSLLKKTEPEAVAVAAVPATPVATGPGVGILIPDSAGISSFRFALQPDAASAEAEIGALSANVRRGTYAFWAMHERPVVDDSMHVEAIVLIRAKPDSDVVYVVSFVDIESAISFTRFEVRRGLHIRNVMIYWAAFTQVREEMEGVSIIPATAPPSVAEVAPLAAVPGFAADLPAPQASVAVAEPEPDTESSVESEARAAVEHYLRANPEKAAEEASAIEEPAQIAEPSIAAEEPAVLDEPEVEEALWPPARAAKAPVISDEPAAVEQAAVEEALVLQHPPVAEPVAEPEAPDADPVVAQRQPAEWTRKRRWARRDKRRQPAEQPELVAGELPEIVSEAAVAEPIVAAPLVTNPGDEETEWEAAAASAAVDPAEGLPKAAKYDEFDIALEVEQLLKNRKWETRAGPFSGFNSPPGRF